MSPAILSSRFKWNLRTNECPERYAGYYRVCYFTNWAQYRPGAGKFKPDYIEADLCTHLIYAFGQLVNNSIHTYEWNDEQLYQTFNGLKNTNPKLKTLLAIGGWNADNKQYTDMVSSAANRKLFVYQSIGFLRKYGFDGLDLDWEYPANRGGIPSEKKNFGILCKELRETFETEAAETGNERLLVTAAVAAGKGTIDTAYDIPVMGQYLDFINLMSYDFHGGWDEITGHNSPLYDKSNEEFTMNYAANYWVTQGTPKSKLIIGLATYGRSFTLKDQTNFGMGAPVKGAGEAGNTTKSVGFLAYYEICWQQISGAGQTFRDNEQKVPYYVNKNQWVGFDDEDSLTGKVHWLVNKGFGGAMVWALPLDDFNQLCPRSTRNFPLVRKITDELLKAENGIGPTQVTTSVPQSTSEQTQTKTGAPTTVFTQGTTIGPTEGPTQDPTGLPGELTCNGRVNGNYADTSDCSKYITCNNGVLLSRSCGNGLNWNQEVGVCDWPDNVECGGSVTTKIPGPTTTTNTNENTSTGKSITTTASSLDFSCQVDGYYEHPTDCQKYIVCSHDIRYDKSCPDGLRWNQAGLYCDFAENIPC